MEAERKHYYWDRLLRGVARGTLMTPVQRADLANEIVAFSDDTDLTKAAKSFAQGKLSRAVVVKGFQDSKVPMDIEEYREKLAPGADVTRQVDVVLAGLLEGKEEDEPTK